MTLRWMREMDRLEGAAATRPALRLDSMAGEWINTNPESRGIQRVTATARDGNLLLRLSCAGEPAPGEWGETAADALFADGMLSDHGMAWTARYTPAGWESRLQGNVNLGLLVLAIFHSSREAGRSSYFAREFYRRTDSPAAVSSGSIAEPPSGGGTVDPQPLLGAWYNTNPAARGIARIDLEQAGGAFTARVQGVGADWGRTPAIPFAHDASSRAAMAFSAAYDFGFQQVELQANVKQGVLVVASFNRFADGDPRSSYFTREFFYR